MLGGRVENVAQHHIHDLRPALGDLASAGLRAMCHAQPVFLDLQELLVQVQDFGGTGTGLQNQPFFGVAKHFVEVPLLGHAAHNTELLPHRQDGTACKPSHSAGCFCAKLGYALRDVTPHKEGVSMTQRSRKQDPLVEIVRSQQEEIKKYKWIESEKIRRDIGWERAIREWMHKDAPDWKRRRWERAVEEALRDEGLGSLN